MRYYPYVTTSPNQNPIEHGWSLLAIAEEHKRHREVW